MGCTVATTPRPRSIDESAMLQLSAVESFTVGDVEGDENVLGIKTKRTARGLLILAMSDRGWLHQWNCRYPTHLVQPGDIVVSLNGITDVSQMVKAMQQEQVFFEFKIKRSVEHKLARGSDFPAERLSRAYVHNANSTMCAICLEEYQDQEEGLLALHCNHVFHRHCVAEWFLKGRHECPLCKQSVVVPAVGSYA